MAMMEVPLLTMLNRYFNKKKGLASGISYMGASLGAVVFPVVFTLLTEEYSIRGTFLLLSGIWLNCCVIGALLRPVPSNTQVPAPAVRTCSTLSLRQTYKDSQTCHTEKEISQSFEIDAGECPDKMSAVTEDHSQSRSLPERKDSKEDVPQNNTGTENLTNSRHFTYWNLLCTIKFVRTLCLTFCGGFAAYGSTFILPALAIEWGSSKFLASLTVSIAAGFEVSSRFLVALFLDRKYVQKHCLLFVNFILAFLSGTVAFLTSTSDYLIAHAIVIGMFGLNFTPIVVPIIADCVKPEQLGSAVGLYILALGGGVGAAYPVLGKGSTFPNYFTCP